MLVPSEGPIYQSNETGDEMRLQWWRLLAIWYPWDVHALNPIPNLNPYSNPNHNPYLSLTRIYP